MAKTKAPKLKAMLMGAMPTEPINKKKVAKKTNPKDWSSQNKSKKKGC